MRAFSSRTNSPSPNLWHLCRASESEQACGGTTSASPFGGAEDHSQHDTVKKRVARGRRCLPSLGHQLRANAVLPCCQRRCVGRELRSNFDRALPPGWVRYGLRRVRGAVVGKTEQRQSPHLAC